MNIVDPKEVIVNENKNGLLHLIMNFQIKQKINVV